VMFLIRLHNLSTEYPHGVHKFFAAATAARGEPYLASEARYLPSS